MDDGWMDEGSRRWTERIGREMLMTEGKERERTEERRVGGKSREWKEKQIYLERRRKGGVKQTI